MNSVGQAYAILNGKLSGNKEEAKNFLNSLPRGVLRTKNRMESRQKSVKKKHRMGY